MTEKKREQVVLRDFRGIVTNIEPTDIGPAAARMQVNLHARSYGELSTRSAWQRMKFDDPLEP